MSPKIVDRQKRHSEILGAAFKVFSLKGYHDTTLSEIAKAAGIGQGTLYYYFKTKEEIFWGVFDEMMSFIEKKVRTHLSAVADPKERLKQLVYLLFGNFPEVGLCNEQDFADEREREWSMAAHGFSLVMMEFWLQAERSGKKEEFYERIELYKKNIIDLLKELFEDVGFQSPAGIDFEVIAHLLMALRDGLSIHLRIVGIDEGNELLQKIQSAIFHHIGLFDHWDAHQHRYQREKDDSNEPSSNS